MGFGDEPRSRCGSSGMPSDLDSTMCGAAFHNPYASNDTSTTEGSPVAARAKSAAAMPPAIVCAPATSPNAIGWFRGYGSPWETREPTDERAQYDVAS